MWLREEGKCYLIHSASSCCSAKEAVPCTLFLGQQSQAFRVKGPGLRDIVDFLKFGWLIFRLFKNKHCSFNIFFFVICLVKVLIEVNLSYKKKTRLVDAQSVSLNSWWIWRLVTHIVLCWGHLTHSVLGSLQRCASWDMSPLWSSQTVFKGYWMNFADFSSSIAVRF